MASEVFLPYSYTVFFIKNKKGVITWRINIRSDEHDPAHFHAVWKDKEISFEPESLTVLNSRNVKPAEETVIKKIVENKKETLKEKFYELNPRLKSL